MPEFNSLPVPSTMVDTYPVSVWWNQVNSERVTYPMSALLFEPDESQVRRNRVVAIHFFCLTYLIPIKNSDTPQTWCWSDCSKSLGKRNPQNILGWNKLKCLQPRSPLWGHQGSLKQRASSISYSARFPFQRLTGRPRSQIIYWKTNRDPSLLSSLCLKASGLMSSLYSTSWLWNDLIVLPFVFKLDVISLPPWFNYDIIFLPPGFWENIVILPDDPCMEVLLLLLKKSSCFPSLLMISYWGQVRTHPAFLLSECHFSVSLFN